MVWVVYSHVPFDFPHPPFLVLEYTLSTLKAVTQGVETVTFYEFLVVMGGEWIVIGVCVVGGVVNVRGGGSDGRG